LQSGPSSITSQKIALRRDLQARLRALPPASRSDASLTLCHHLTRLLPNPAGQLVAGFLPLPTEPNLLTFYHHLLAHRASLALPRLTSPGHMEFRELPPAAPHSHPAPNPLPCLLPGPFGLWQPDPAHCRQVSPNEITFALVPGLGFAPGGARLGRGAGYYDRWLPLLPTTTPTVGIAFSCQLCPTLPVDPHDHPLDFLLTENGWSQGARAQPSPAA